MPKKRKVTRSSRGRNAGARKAKRKATRKTTDKTPRRTARKTAGKPRERAAPAERKTTTERPATPTTALAVARSLQAILNPRGGVETDPSFRDAPTGWTRERAQAVAVEAGIRLTEDVWEVVRVLQGCYKDEVAPRLRLLSSALDARFAGKGGMRYLYEVLPGGPVLQGCALAGLKPPPGARDLSFGSVA